MSLFLSVGLTAQATVTNTEDIANPVTGQVVQAAKAQTPVVTTTLTDVPSPDIDEALTGEGQPRLDTWKNMYNYVYALLVFLSSLIVKGFKIKKKIPNFALVVIAGGLVIAIGFTSFGLTEFLPTAFILFSTMGVFDGLRATGRAMGLTEK